MVLSTLKGKGRRAVETIGSKMSLRISEKNISKLKILGWLPDIASIFFHGLIRESTSDTIPGQDISMTFPQGRIDHLHPWHVTPEGRTTTTEATLVLTSKFHDVTRWIGFHSVKSTFADADFPLGVMSGSIAKSSKTSTSSARSSSESKWRVSIR